MKDQMIMTFFKNLPGMAASALSYLFHMPLERWVLLATLIHVVLQVILLLRKAWKGKTIKPEDLQ